MATYNLTVTSDADDGDENNGTTWNDQTSEGYPAGERFRVRVDGADMLRGAVRFVSTGIPQGAVVDEATLTINIRFVNSIDAVNSVITIIGDDADNSGAFGAGHRPSSGWTDTTATVNVAGLATGDRAIDVTAIVQEIVDRPGFGGNIAFKLVPTGSDTYWSAEIADYDSDTAATKPRLDVITLEGDPGPSITNVDGDDAITQDQVDIEVNGTGFDTAAVFFEQPGGVSVEQTVGDETATVLTLADVTGVGLGGALKNGTVSCVVVNDDDQEDSSDFDLSPPADVRFVDIASIAEEGQTLTAVPALEAGDQVEHRNVQDESEDPLDVDDVEVFDDTSVSWEPAVSRFQVRYYDDTEKEWSDWVWQTIDAIVEGVGGVTSGRAVSRLSRPLVRAAARRLAKVGK